MTGDAIDELRRLAELGVEPLQVIDLCAGSGAVGLAIASEVPDVVVTAVEVSAEACAYALRNASAVLGADRDRYDLREGDIADVVDDLAGRVHVVVANPPYIPLAAFESVAPEARDFDPPVALWSGEDGLDAITVVAEVAARLLVDDGLLVCEHADVQGESAPAVFSAAGSWTRVRDMRDLAGRPRYVSARRVPRAAATAGTMVS
jgi:release factor glutamine methyltransferase